VKNATICTPCPVGTYQPTDGMISCIPCSNGTYGSSNGSTTCTKCPAGNYMLGVVLKQQGLTQAQQILRSAYFALLATIKTLMECLSAVLARLERTQMLTELPVARNAQQVLYSFWHF
jgi:hypothetical protein